MSSEGYDRPCMQVCFLCVCVDVSSTRAVKNVNRHSAWGLFTKVYAVQPSAMLLPPPPCGAASSTSHGDHRILWGLDVAAWPL